MAAARGMRWSEEELQRHQARGRNEHTTAAAGGAAPGRAPAPAARAERIRVPQGGGRAGLDPRMNRWEAAYALEVLEPRRLAGELAEWGFEDTKLRLADRTWYTPDFRVVGVGGETEFHEVKGFWRDDARVKLKVAARLFPRYRFLAVRRRKKREGGGWQVEVLP